jgi:integrase
MDWDDFKSLIGKLERDGEYKFCLLFSIGVFTGLRISDLLKLRFNQFENSEILTIQEQKTKKTRRIKINADLKEIVERLKGRMVVVDTNQYIFVNRYGTKPIDKSYVNVKLKELLKQYGIVMEGNASSHLFRKTLGNRVLRLNNYSDGSVILLMESVVFDFRLFLPYYLVTKDINEGFAWSTNQMPSCTNKVFRI